MVRTLAPRLAKVRTGKTSASIQASIVMHMKRMEVYNLTVRRDMDRFPRKLDCCPHPDLKVLLLQQLKYGPF